VTPIFVVWVMTAPFCAVIVVGIVSFCAHMLFFALAGMFVARTEWGPCGNVVTNELIGASGTLLNVLVVIPFLMFVLPSRYSVMPSPWRTNTRSGNAAPP